MPTGGQFAPSAHAEADIELAARGSVPADIAAALKSAAASRAAAQEHEERTAMKAAAAYVRSIHPDADRIILKQFGDDNGYEMTHFRVDEIVDDDGREIATGDDEDLDEIIGSLTDDDSGDSIVPWEEGDEVPWRTGAGLYTSGHSYIPIDDALSYDHTAAPVNEDVAVALNAAAAYIADARRKQGAADTASAVGASNALVMAETVINGVREMTGAHRVGGVTGTARRVTPDTITCPATTLGRSPSRRAKTTRAACKPPHQAGLRDTG